MSTKNAKSRPAYRAPLSGLVRLGTLAEVLKSDASPEIKFACIEMAIDAEERSRKK